MNDRNLAKILHEALAIETQEAREAGALGYMARVLVVYPEANLAEGSYGLLLKPSKSHVPQLLHR